MTYTKAMQVRGKTLSLHSVTVDMPFAHLTQWRVVHVNENKWSSATIALMSKAGITCQVEWPTLKRWIREGVIDVT